MKKLVVLTFAFLFTISLASAVCDLDLSLLSQDPYPASPGEIVKLVFQLDGLSNTGCGDVSLRMLEEFPFSLEGGEENPVYAESGFYKTGFKDALTAFYNVRVNKDALEGENEITLEYSTQSGTLKETFEITIEDTRTDFEVSVSSYSKEDKTLNLELLNVGESSANAVTVEIPEQANIAFYGTNRKIVGDMDADEDDSASFQVDILGETIDLIILYTDETNTRRDLSKKVYFNEDAFSRKIENNEGSTTKGFLFGLIFSLILYFGFRYYKKRKIRRLRDRRH